jgi:predicted DNA-binding transcriptional regulator
VVDEPPDTSKEFIDAYLKGTTYKVYRYMLKHGQPMGVSQVQKGLRLSSPSVSQYHIRKLVKLGLLKEEQAGYVVDKVVLENVVRIKRVSAPIHAAYVAFFAATLVVITGFLRPSTFNSLFFFAVVVNVAALGISLYEMRRTLKRL